MGGGCSCKHVENLGVYWNFRSQATVHMLFVFLLNLKKDNHKIIQQLFFLTYQLQGLHITH